jgi:hypothetical protein
MAKTRFHVIPFVDIDGVEEGDQGKNRNPHDHNRDYTERPIYRSVTAITDYVQKLPNVVAGIDFHAPFKWGNRDDQPFFVKQASPIKEKTEQFAAMLETKSNGWYHPGNDVELNTLHWHTDATAQVTFVALMRRKKSPLCFTYEFPYFGRGERIYTQSLMRSHGKDFARTLEEMLPC